MSGVFITFEGVEGAGKTTVLDLLYEKMIQEDTKTFCGPANREELKSRNKSGISF